MKIIELRQRHMRLCDNSKTQDPFKCEDCIEIIKNEVGSLNARWLTEEDVAIINAVNHDSRKTSK